MEYLFVQNIKMREKIKAYFVEEKKWDEYSAKLNCYIDYKNIYFFVALNEKLFGTITISVLVKSIKKSSIVNPIFAIIKIENVRTINDILYFVTNSINDETIDFNIIEASYCSLGLPPINYYTSGMIKGYLEKEIPIRESDRIYSSYDEDYIYIDVCTITVDSYHDNQLFRKTYEISNTGKPYLVYSYPSCFVLIWNKIKHFLTPTKFKNGIPYDQTIS